MPFGKMEYESIVRPNIYVYNHTILICLIKNYFRYGIVHLILLVTTGLSAQKNVWIIDGDSIAARFEDSVSAHRAVRKFLNAQILNGYVYASLDSSTFDRDSYYFDIHLGTRERWSPSQVLIDSMPSSSKKRQIGDQLAKLGDNGYPFATLRLFDVERREEGITAEVYITSEEFIQYDTLVVQNSKTDLKKEYLWKYLGLEPGEPYSESAFRKIPLKVARSNLFDLNSDPDLAIADGRAIVYLDIKENQVSSFEGLAGLQRVDNRSVLMGYLNLTLGNLFSSGKELSLNWNRFQSESQKLNVRYSNPYIFLTDINVGGEVDIIRQDTSFTSTSYQLNASSEFFSSMWFGIQFSRFLSTSLRESTDMLTENVKTSWYGINLSTLANKNYFERRSYFGYSSSLELGDRRVLATNSSVTPNQLVFRINLESQAQLEFGSRSSFVFNGVYDVLRNEFPFQNEMIRLGGLKSFRGFNEFELFVTEAITGQFEYRYYFERLSYLQVFTDLGLINSPNFGDNLRSIASFGFGFGLQTDGGVFNLVLANGMRPDDQFNFTYTNVHFGYVSRF